MMPKFLQGTVKFRPGKKAETDVKSLPAPCPWKRRRQRLFLLYTPRSQTAPLSAGNGQRVGEETKRTRPSGHSVTAGPVLGHQRTRDPGQTEAPKGVRRIGCAEQSPGCKQWGPGHLLMEKPPGSSWATLQRSSNRAPRGCARHGHERQPPGRAGPPRPPRPYLGLVRAEVKEEVDHQLHQAPLGHCRHRAVSARNPPRNRAGPPKCPSRGPNWLTAALLGAPHAQLGRHICRLPGQRLQLFLVVPHLAARIRANQNAPCLSAAVLPEAATSATKVSGSDLGSPNRGYCACALSGLLRDLSLWVRAVEHKSRAGRKWPVLK